MTTDTEIEQEIQAKGLTAPRVTHDSISAKIASEHYFTAGEGVFGAAGLREYGETQHLRPEFRSLGLLTFCVLIMKNGFTVVGKSACASPENFDAELGKKIARQDAFNQLWPLEGYLLKEQLSK